MDCIINLTQHLATPEQIDAGVVDLPDLARTALTELLTFEDLPTLTEIDTRAYQIAELGIASDCAQAMIGGAPYLMRALERALFDVEIIPRYAFSKRVSVDEIQSDGIVVKVNKFKHLGFVGALSLLWGKFR